jgi:hypothetical protein
MKIPQMWDTAISEGEYVMNSFNIAEVLDEAWSLTKRQYWHWLLVVVVAVLVPGIIVGIGIAAALAVPALGAIVIIIGILGFFYTFLGLLRNAYNASEGAKPSVGVLFRSDRFWWFLVAGAVYIGIVVTGLFALIIPGLIFAFMFALFPFALIGNPGMTGFAALARSWELITTSFWRYIGLRVVLFGATAALVVLSVSVQTIFDVAAGNSDTGAITAILIIIGLVIAVFINVFLSAFTYLADALAYRRLSNDGEVLRPN